MTLSLKKLPVSFILCLAIVGLPITLSARSNRPQVSPERLREGGFIDGTYPGNWNDTARISQNFEFRRAGPRFSLKRNTLNADQGNIAVIEDDGTIVFPANHYDLDNSNIRFTPNGSGYLVSKIAQNFDPATGSILVPGTVSPSPGQPPGPNLSDDDATQVPFSGGFTFTFFGQTYTSVFVGSDGYLTFGSGDPTSDDRDLVRFLGRQPRIGPLFADLEPGCGTGDVRTLQRSDRFIAIWNDIPNFSDSCTNVNRDHNTFEVVLFADGSIEFSFNGMGTSEGIVGLAPGNNLGKPPSVVDYTTLTAPTPEFGVIFEFFSTSIQVSRTALAEKFFQTHGDDYDFITFLTNFNFNLGPGAFAFEENVSNDATGLGALPVFQPDPAWGTKGRLRSFLTLGPLSQYPNDPNQANFLGTNSPVEVIGQEFGHRWMAFVDIPGATCDPTTNPQTFVNSILGRDCAHWSFFFNSDGSVMEGNDIQDNGNGTFTTKDDATSKYGDLDQYLMGLRDQSEVSPAFVVFNPTGTGRTNGSAPAVGVTFGGTKHTVTVNDIISANVTLPDGTVRQNGLRTPTPATSPKAFRQAWILLVQRNTTPTAADVAKIDTMRQAWQSFFSIATNGRGTVDTSLVPNVFNAQLPANGGASEVSSGEGALSVTYGQMTNTTSAPPVALSIFGLTQNGALVTEAGVPASAASTSARVFVDFNSQIGLDSGVALVNPGASPLSVNVTLMSQAGVSSSCPGVQVVAHGHVAEFASQFGCPSLTSPFLGTLTFTAAAPFAAVNLRAARNARGEQIFSALPVVDPTLTPSGSNLIFSQIVDGGGNPTQILLMNNSGSAVAGTVSLFKDDGTPASLDFGSGLVSSFPYSINANGVQKFSTTGQGQIVVAYAVVTPTSGQLPSGASIFGSRGATGVASQAGVLNAIPTTNARVYIERASVPLNRNTGIALVNRNASSANVTLHLVSLDGSFDQTTSKSYNSNAHDAKFIDQFFPAGLVPADFKGVLTIQSNQPLAIVTLRLTNNQRSEEIFSTLPVADLNHLPVGPLFIPQVVDGGGYTTQIILINTTSGGGTVGITFQNDSGSTVIVPFS
jgi:hypothetical protein